MRPNSHIVTLLIPHELSGLVVRGYSECGTYISAKTAALRKESQQRAISRLRNELEACKGAKMREKIESELKRAENANTHLGNRTNRDRRLIGVFITLKAITTSSYISNYRGQAAELERYCKKNFKSIQGYIEQLQELGLVKITGRSRTHGRSLQLASWKTLCDLFALEFTNQFTTYNYDLNNPQQTPDYVLDGAEECEKQQQLNSKLIKTIRRNHRVVHFLQQHFGISDINEKAVQQIEALRRSWFVNGFPSRSSHDEDFAYAVAWLYSLNTCTARTRKTLGELRNALQPRTITRLKRSLALRSIANVENIILQSKCGVRVPSRNLQANGFNLQTKSPTWYLPTHVSVPEFTTVAA